MSTNAPNHRVLRFTTLDDILGDAHALAGADERAGLLASGNWTLGQTLNHVAVWAGFAFEGFPFPPVPGEQTEAMRALLAKILQDGMPENIRLPGVSEGTFGVEVVPTQFGLSRLVKNLERLRASAPPGPSPLFGAMTHSEWIGLNCRHAELHFSRFQVA